METTVKKYITSTLDCKIEFDGLTLLSKKEYDKYKDNIQPVHFKWWLRLPVYNKDYASYIDSGGVFEYCFVDNINIFVRPVLILKSHNLLIGDKFKFYNHDWKIISKKYAICNDSFCDMKFREYWEVKNANDYDASDIKKYLDEQFERMKACVV